MTITTRRVTGPIVLPDGSVPANGRVIIKLSGWDREDGQGIMAGPITISLDENGIFDADLWCTDTGENGRVYTGLIRWLTGAEWRLQNIQFDVPSGTGDMSFAPIWVVGDLPLSTQADALAQCLAAAASAAASAGVASDATVNAAAVAADRAAAETARDQAQTAAANAQASALTCATWAVLSTLTGSTEGVGAEVLDTDTGTHTDPVVGGTVPNAGRYTWSASPAGWERIWETGLSGKLDKTSYSALSWFCATGGTENALMLTNAIVTSLVNGLRLRFTATYTNTTAVVTAQVNGKGPFAIKTQGNSDLGIGVIKSGWTYDLHWSSESNTLKLIGISDQYLAKATQGSLIASAVAGSANAIEVTADFARVNGSILIFKAAYTNTSVNVSLAVNGSAATYIRTASGGTLKLGDIAAGRWLMVRYDATGGNPWVLISSGITLGDLVTITDKVTTIDSRVTALEAVSDANGLFTTEALALMEKINGPSPGDAAWASSPRNPKNFFTWSEGVRTTATPLDLKIMVAGCSTDKGDQGAVGGASSHGTMLASAINTSWGRMKNLNATSTVVAVGGTTVNQFLAQITGAAAGDYHIVMGMGAENTAGISPSDQGQIENVFTKYGAIVDEIRNVRHAMPIILDSMHPHLTYPNPPEMLADNYRMVWPYSTYQVTANHTFDSGAGTIALVNINVYGKTLAAGDTLIVASGSAAGTYTITSIDWLTGVVNVAEPIPYTGTYSVQVSNLPVDDERVAWPPLSERIVWRDRTGRGMSLPGFSTFDEYNRRLAAFCAKNGVMLWSMQAMQYRYYEDKIAAGLATASDLQGLSDTFYFSDVDGRRRNHPIEDGYNYCHLGLIGEFMTRLYDGSLPLHRVLMGQS